MKDYLIKATSNVRKLETEKPEKGCTRLDFVILLLELFTESGMQRPDAEGGDGGSLICPHSKQELIPFPRPTHLGAASADWRGALEDFKKALKQAELGDSKLLAKSGESSRTAAQTERASDEDGKLAVLRPSERDSGAGC